MSKQRNRRRQCNPNRADRDEMFGFLLAIAACFVSRRLRFSDVDVSINTAFGLINDGFAAPSLERGKSIGFLLFI